MNPTQNTTRNLRRGFSIVEVMIAMTVVTIVCFSTLTILLSSQVSATRAMKHQQAQFYVEDIINCYRVSSS
jgi:prepilin-type N-terminal cleavage/methylation domain-containing protein